MKKQKIDLNDCGLYITDGTQVQGAIQSNGLVYIEGYLEGQLYSTGMI